MKPDLNTMLKKFGDRITASQSDSHDGLALTADEMSRMRDWATTEGPLTPKQDPLGELQMPQRPGAINSTMPPNTDLLEQASWYGGQAIFNLLSRRGFQCTQDDCQIVAALSHFRPFGFLDDFLTSVYERPREINSMYNSSLQRAIDGTEAWLAQLHESKVFQELTERPISKSDFGRELRQLGAVNDPHLAGLAIFCARQGDKVLMPGGAVALGLDHVIDFYLDSTINESGAPICAGMRAFHDLITDLARSNDPTLKEIVGNAIEREISTITAPLIGEVLSHPLARYRVTGQLMFLRDGLLRLCNKHLNDLHQAVNEISKGANIGKLIELLEPETKLREAFLLNHKVDLALLSEKPAMCLLVRELLQVTPSERRTELFQLVTTAPKLLECIEMLASNTKPATIAAAIPDLMRPLTYTEPPSSLAQLITAYHDGGQRGIARLLIDNRAMFARSLCTYETHDIGNKLIKALEFKVLEGVKGGQIAAFVSQVGDYVRGNNLIDAHNYLDSYLASHSQQSAPAPSTDSPGRITTERAPQEDDKRGWASWAGDLVTSPQAKTALDNDMQRFGDTAWYKQIVLTPDSLSEYVSALNAGDLERHQEILAQSRVDPPAEEASQTAHTSLENFTKIIFIGGLHDQTREAKLRELLPTSCDVSFYYADASANSFRNMTAISLAGDDQALAVYLPNFTSHSMYYKACDLAESAGAKLVVLPKGAQNPRVIVERLREMLS